MIVSVPHIFQTALAFALAATCTTSYAQNNNLAAGDTTQTNTTLPKEEDEQKVIRVIEIMPEFPCGEVGLRKYLEVNTVYPEEAKNKGLEGKVFVNFAVSVTGDVEDVKIERGVDPILDNEAILIVQSMPKWKPGMQRGKPVRTTFTLSVAFPPNNIASSTETGPEFPGGAYALEKYISQQLSEHLKTVKNKTGKYSFIINKQGHAENIRVVRRINSTIDNIVVSVLQDMPQWNCACFRKEPDKWPVTVSIMTNKYGRLSVSIETMWVK